MLRRMRPQRRSRWQQLRDEWRRAPRDAKALVVGSAALGGVYVASHVETMEETGRRRLMLLSPIYEEQLGQSAYEQVLRSSKVLPPSHPMTRAVLRVGRKIEEQADLTYMKWEFHVIEANEPNAFCLPGGKVFVHTGLFKLLSNEDTLAAVLFHEAAHGIARHGAEKISVRLLVFGLLALVFPDFGQLSDLIAKLAVDLPFSRKLELEADSIGLRLMAKACFDPQASVQMHAAFEKLQADSSSSFTKYFSTHPPSRERIQALRDQLKSAEQIYELSGCSAKKKAFARSVNGSRRLASS